MPNRYQTGSGTNSSGNSYRSYSDGSYSYNNAPASQGGTGGAYGSHSYTNSSGGTFYNENSGGRGSGHTGKSSYTNSSGDTKTYTERSYDYKTGK